MPDNLKRISFKSILRLFDKAEYVYPVTGTPIPANNKAVTALITEGHTGIHIYMEKERLRKRLYGSMNVLLIWI